MTHQTTTAGRTQVPEIKYMDLQEFIDEGYLHEVNRLVLHPLGLALQLTTGSSHVAVWDCRDDPEGVLFDESTLSAEKALNVVKQMFAKRGPRIKATGGFVIQPIPGEKVLTTNYTDPSLLDQVADA